MNQTKLKLIVLNFLQLAAWGAYLTTMGRYLGKAGMGDNIGVFYAVLGFVSIFMPALVGIIADRWIPAQKTLGLSHIIAGIGMLILGYFGQITDGSAMISYPIFLGIFTFSVAFYMPTLGLCNSVSYFALEREGMDKVKEFPPIRVWGTIGFIIFMQATDIFGLQTSSFQFVISGVLSLLIGFYSFSLTNCPIEKEKGKRTFIQILGLDAFSLFKERRVALFFIFSMLLGVSLQVSNGYANPFLSSFSAMEEYKNSFIVNHSNLLLSVARISETLCILLIPFFLKRFGIKKVMLMSMASWFIYFTFFAFGNPGFGISLFIIAMLIYGLAFDFFNVSGSLFVDEEVDTKMRSSAQGLFMLMTNGLGSTIGMIIAQFVINHYCHWENDLQIGDWKSVWILFSIYSLLILIGFAIFFHPKKKQA